MILGLAIIIIGAGLAGSMDSIASPTLSVEVLALAGAGEQGRAAAAQGLATPVGVAVPTGLGGTVVALQGAGTDGRRSPHSWRCAESSPSSAAGSARDADLAVDRPARDVGAVVRAGQLDAADRGIRPMAGLLQRGPGPDHGEHPSTS